MKSPRLGRGGGVRLGLLIGASLVGACASSGATTVVEPRELDQADGRPRIRAVRDVGGIDIPSLGVLRPQASDGAAVIGETLWIQGDDFGRQPTVSIGGRSTAVVSRTADGGILVRVPPRTPSGRQPLVVTQEHGQASFELQVRRLGGVLAFGRLGFFQLDAGAPRAVPLRAGDQGTAFRKLQLSTEGRAAYALDDQGDLRVFDLTAPQGPAEVPRLALGPGEAGEAGEDSALLAATGASRMVLVRKGEIVLLDTALPLRPARVGGGPLPAWLGRDRIQAASLSPDGRWLALALDRKNRVVLLEVDRLPGAGAPEAPARAGALAELALLPEVLAPVLVDLAFAPDGRTLWVLSGVTPESRTLGPRATEVHALRLQSGDPGAHGPGDGVRMERARVVVIEGADRPMALSTGRNLPLASGSAVRLPPERATVFVAAQALGAGGGPTIYAVGEGESASRLLAEAELTQVGRLDVTPDGTWVVAAFLGRGGDLQVAVAPADRRPRSVRSAVVLSGLPAAGTDGLGPTELRLQP